MATPRSWSIVAGMPRPGGDARLGRASFASASSRPSSSISLSSLSPVEGSAALVVDLLIGVDDPDRHLRPPEVDADGLRGVTTRPDLDGSRQEGSEACASIDTPCLRREMIGRRGGPGAPRAAGSPRSPSHPASPGAPARADPARSPSTRSTGARAGAGRSGPLRRARSRARGGRSRLPRLPLSPEPARPVPQAEPGEPADRDRRRAAGAAGCRAWSGGKRPWLRWVLIVVVGWLLLSFITFAISAQIQKGKLPQSAKDALKGGPAVLLGQNILILGGDRRGQDPEQRQRQRGPGPAARGHDHGPARLPDLVPQALDPARQLRLDPGLRRPEDQRLARLQHRTAPTATPPRRSRPSRTSSASTSTTS